MMAPTRSFHLADEDGSAVGGGGAEIVFDMTVQAAKQLGHDVTRLTVSPVRSAISYVYSRENFKRVSAILHRAQPDIVHIQNYYHFLSPSVLLAIRRYKRQRPHTRVIFTAHDFHLICPNSGFQHFVRSNAVSYDVHEPRIRWFHKFDHRSWVHSTLKLVQHVYAYKILHLERVIDAIISPSEIIATAFRSARITAPIHVIRNPIAIGSTPLRRDRSGLVFLGKLTPAKGLIDFVETLESQQISCRIDVYGDGPQRNALVDFASSSRYVDLAIHGHVHHDDVPELLTRHIALVYPSTWLENAPLAVLEAAQVGLPVVVPRGGGAEEVARLTRVHFAYDSANPHSAAMAVTDALERGDINSLLDEHQFHFETYVENLKETYAASATT